jgi:hypothetical protein
MSRRNSTCGGTGFAGGAAAGTSLAVPGVCAVVDLTVDVAEGVGVAGVVFDPDLFGVCGFAAVSGCF